MSVTFECQYFWCNNKKFSEIIFQHVFFVDWKKMFQHALMVSNDFFDSARCTNYVKFFLTIQYTLFMFASLHKVVRILIWTFSFFWIPYRLLDSQNACSSGLLTLNAFYASLYVCKILLCTVFLIFIITTTFTICTFFTFFI